MNEISIFYEIIITKTNVSFHYWIVIVLHPLFIVLWIRCWTVVNNISAVVAYNIKSILKFSLLIKQWHVQWSPVNEEVIFTTFISSDQWTIQLVCNSCIHFCFCIFPLYSCHTSLSCGSESFFFFRRRVGFFLWIISRYFTVLLFLKQILDLCFNSLLNSYSFALSIYRFMNSLSDGCPIFSLK